MGTITTTDGTEIFYKDWGSGRPVVFSHGWPLTADAWDDQLFLVASNGYRAIAHDRRGGGRSGQPWTGNDLDTYADDLAAHPRNKQEEQDDRSAWPWLPGSILEQCGPDEWRVRGGPRASMLDGRHRTGQMTIADLARHLSRAADDRTRWKLVWEFLEEYRWEPGDVQPSLLVDEPLLVGDERWDALLAALAEHLAAQHDLAPPAWTELRVLRQPWFPAETQVQRADALARAPAAFRKHGAYLSATDLEAA